MITMRIPGLLLLLSLSVNAWCEEKPFYVGGELGGAKLSDDGMSDFQSTDLTTGALRVFGGYQINRSFAAEVAIDWLGNYESETIASDISSDYSAITLSALGKIPLSNNLSFYAQLGFGFASIYQDVAAISGPYFVTGQTSDTGAATLFGAGFSFTIPTAKEVEIRAGVQQLAFNVSAYAMDNAGYLMRHNYDQHIREFYLGAAYRF